MKKIIFALMVFLPVVAFTDDKGVVERKTCSEIQVEIQELSELSEPTDEELTELETLQAQYDSTCIKKRQRHKSVATPNVTADADSVTDQVVTETDVATEEISPEPELSEAEIEANLDAGLCPNGEKYNKFGCCPGERFTDLGDGGYACCEIDNKDVCYPAKGMSAE